MKKIILAICIFTVSFFLVSCEIGKTNYEITLDMPDFLYIGDSMILEPTSSNVNDKFTFQSSNVDVALVDTTGNIRALSVGTTIITVTNATNNIFEKEVMVLALPPVEGLQLNVVSEQNNLFYVGKIYQVTLDFLPDKSYDSDVRYSYTASFIDFDDKTGNIKFSKAGTYNLTAYLASDWQTQTTIEFEVVYSDEVEAYNLLFIGNSLTKYTYNIPNFIYEMLRADDVVVNFLLDSTTPQWIIDHEINFNFLITKDQYTHVFLQEYSNGPIMDYKKFEDAVVLFDKKIKAQGAKTVLYQTWGYNYEDALSRDNMTNQLGALYEQAATKIDATLSPVGYAFLSISQNHPEINLYQDLNHPSLYGALLSAYTHYAVLTNRSPLENDWVHLDLDETIMTILKQAAHDTVFNS